MIQPKNKTNKKRREAKREKVAIMFIYGILIFAILVLFFTAKSMFFSKPETNLQTSQATMQVSTTSRMSLTSYDKELAKEFMDKDNDGKCDVCGMLVEQCIGSGQLQCNMDSKSTIGILGSEHIHADWKVYINGKTLSFEDKDHMGIMRNNLPVSSFIHVDSGAPAPEKTGDILHMHATGVPLWIFFKSVGMDFNKECLSLSDGQKACNDDKNTLKFYVNGKPNNELENYVFKDLDKILISYGSETNLEPQIEAITNFAKNH